MPLYEYQCDACGNRFERIQKFSDPPIDTCPACQAGPVQKLLSSPAIQFKGTGWYITDYARKATDKPSTNGSGAKSESGGESKPAETTSESKTESKSDSKGSGAKAE